MITTDVPARLERLPWPRWNRRIVIGPERAERRSPGSLAALISAVRTEV
ncbi:hypothetical protein AB0C76_05270 [Kitasatospora sp. NPDC048722]